MSQTNQPVEQEPASLQNEENDILKSVQEVLAKKYLGLSNQGATCYMNSLLQSLFMTQEFRQHLYDLKYDPAQHGKPEDCLPLQLQILFSRLQMASNSKYVDTKPLINTFGWTNNQMFQQQDVQEFCKVLFDAIERSFDTTKESAWIRDLYEGQTENFVHCKTCGKDSTKSDQFLDLQLIISSPFDNIANDSIESCLKHLIKSDELTGDNQYFCEECNKKVDATKGVRFKQLPPVLMLQLNRYSLNYETMQRQKICDRVSFPEILDMNEFFKKFEDITIPVNPLQEEKIKKVDEITIHKPSTNSIQNKKDKNETQQATTEAEQPIASEDFCPLFGDDDDNDRTAAVAAIKKDETNNSNSKQPENEKKPIEKNEKKNEEEGGGDNFALFGDITPKKSVRVSQHPALISRADEVHDLGVDENDIYWGTDVNEEVVKETNSNLEQMNNVLIERENIRKKEIIEENIIANQKNQIKRKQLLEKKGEHVYELYAVNVHSGGAHGGHYFSYIKSFENQQWYNFNDSQVNLIKTSALEAVFGSSYSKNNQNTSAYMLMYRKVTQSPSIEATTEESKEKVNIPNTEIQVLPQIPEEIIKMLLEEDTLIIKKQEEAKKRKELRERQVEVKIFKNEQEEQATTLHFDRYDTNLEDIKLEVMKTLGITEDLNNWRLRGYKKYEKLSGETYTGKESIPLIELDVRDTLDLIVEYKKEKEEFEDYDPSKILVVVKIWNESRENANDDEFDLANQEQGNDLFYPIKQNYFLERVIDILFPQKSDDQRNKQIGRALENIIFKARLLS